MKVLVINCGSSSLKYKLFEMKTETCLLTGIVERVGTSKGRASGKLIQHSGGRSPGKSVEIPSHCKNHTEAFYLALKAMMHPRHGAIKCADDIQAVGHRVVHGGPSYRESVTLTPQVIQDIKKFSIYAPLHNPANLAGIKAGMRTFKNAAHVAVFDTAFHQTIPEHAYRYGISYELAEKYKIRKYGFHGFSHQYVAERTAVLLGKPLKSLKVVTCHIGAGTSIAAVEYGHSSDTSMGMTPLQGVIMGTRSGSIDPSIVEFLMEMEKLDFKQIIYLLNNQSGLYGLSGISKDVRDLEKAAVEGNKRALMTLAVHSYQVKKFIGAYIYIMGGVDAIAFTAGVGENSFRLRSEVCRRLEFLGTKLNEAKNQIMVGGKEGIISTKNSKVKILVVPTNEEIMIARETVK